MKPSADVEDDRQKDRQGNQAECHLEPPQPAGELPDNVRYGKRVRVRQDIEPVAGSWHQLFERCLRLGYMGHRLHTAGSPECDGIDLGSDDISLNVDAALTDEPSGVHPRDGCRDASLGAGGQCRTA